MSETASKVSAALVAAQSEIGNVPFDSVNPHFGSKFVSLAGVLAAVRPVLNRHGIMLMQPAATEGGVIRVQTVFLHSSGEQVSLPALTMPMTDKMNAQNCGSVVTYLRRYSLCAALAIAGDEDEDGNADATIRGSTPAKAGAQSSGNSGQLVARPSKPAAPAESATARRADHVPAKPAAPAPARTMGVDVIGTVVYVKSEPGEKNGKPYTKHRIGIKKQGDTETTWLTSFSDAVGEAATAENKTGTVMCGILGGKSGDLLTDLFPQQTAHVPAEVTFGEEIPF
jgi:pyruvate/2-oxoglutarate dehydrogenase complex dihydrolipoamide acyltransferase (E2) component